MVQNRLHARNVHTKAAMRKIFMLKHIFYYGILCSLLFSSTSFAMDDYSDYNNDFELDEFDKIADSVDWEPRVVDCIPASDIVSALTMPPFLLQNRLLQNVYLFTNPPNQRSLLDLPQFLLHQWPFIQPRQFSWALFYNENSKMNYTQDGNTVEAYLNLNNADLLQDIEDLFDIDIPTAIELVSVLKLQERRLGVMLDFYTNYHKWNLEVKFPFYYLERNFYVTPLERDAIERFFASLVPGGEENGTPDEVDEVAVRKHLVSDKIGLGDTRVTVGYLAADKESFKFNIGGEATVPTGLAFASGMLGSKFAKNDLHTPLSIFELFQLGTCMPRQLELAMDIAKAFLVSASDKLSANLLETGMGNNSHLGLAAFMENTLLIAPRFHIDSRAALECLLPHSEKRFYINKKYPEAFLGRDYADSAQAMANLNFLNQQLIDTLIPKVYNTMVFPGFIFKFDTALSYNLTKGWNVTLGYDVWWQSKERLGNIQATPKQLSLLRKDLAIRPTAYQGKIFMSTYVASRKGELDWLLSFYVDKTFVQSGIGKDFNISLHFAMNM